MMISAQLISGIIDRCRTIGSVFILSVYLMGCAECEVDYDCSGNEICKVSVGQCAPVECSLDRDCPPDRYCSRNQCVASQRQNIPDEADALVLEPNP